MALCDHMIVSPMYEGKMTLALLDIYKNINIGMESLARLVIIIVLTTIFVVGGIVGGLAYKVWELRGISLIGATLVSMLGSFFMIPLVFRLWNIFVRAWNLFFSRS